jgi:hypothetical protein
LISYFKHPENDSVYNVYTAKICGKTKWSAAITNAKVSLEKYVKKHIPFSYTFDFILIWFLEKILTV